MIPLNFKKESLITYAVVKVYPRIKRASINQEMWNDDITMSYACLILPIHA